jgi:hypothetical protein
MVSILFHGYSTNCGAGRSTSKLFAACGYTVSNPMGHNLVIISRCKDVEEALFYIHKIIENNWGRSILTHQIESGLFENMEKQ